MGLAILAHRRRWLTGPIITISGIFFAIPSVAAFFLLQPITGLGYTTAMVALVSYTLLIIFRNITTGLRNVPAETRDAALGQGLTERQVLYRVELPMAVPEIMAGLRVASSTTVGLAALAVFAGAGGLGHEILVDKYFKSNVVVAGGLAVLLAAALDLLILGVQRLMTPWQRARA
jgi:osmoprotectant transport system permease protein